MALSIKEKIKSVEELIQQDIFDYVESNYGIDYALLLKGIVSDHFTIDRNLLEMIDDRKVEDYLTEVLLGWITEDFIFNLIDESGMEVYKVGTDKDRKILRKTNVSTSPDLLTFRVWENNEVEPVKIEVVVDYTGFWSRTNCYHLRHNKLPNLLKQSKTENVCLLFFDIKNKKIGIVPISDNMDKVHIPSHRFFGGKPAWEVKLDYPSFVNFDNVFDLFYNVQFENTSLLVS